MSKLDADWQILHTLDASSADHHGQIIDLLLQNRGISPVDKQEFLDPQRPGLEVVDCLPDLDRAGFDRAQALLHQAVDDKRPIIVYGDYDCDGVSATAILWETLNDLGALARPFIPHRLNHGYGLSEKGLSEAIEKITTEFPSSPDPLIITVDNGITAIDQVESLKSSGLPVIITDHHQPKTKIPSADAVVHTTALCGSGVSWLLSSHLKKEPLRLDLAALATVCDLLPLTGINRSIVKYGLIDLQTTRRPGLKALYQASGIFEPSSLSAYHLGFILGPRINAIGRLGQAFDALRLLCTNDPLRAFKLAEQLSQVNRQRQDLTETHTKDAVTRFASLDKLPNILVVQSSEYHEGIIGLIASRLAENFSRPALAIAVGGNLAKGSARSVSGVDITALLSEVSDHLLEFGGHTQAAGFALSPKHLDAFTSALLEKSIAINPSLLKKTVTVDIGLSLDDLTFPLLEDINRFAPFGIANPKPVFSARLPIKDTRIIGKNRDHLLLSLDYPRIPKAVAFGQAEKQSALQPNEPVDAAFNFDLDDYNGNHSLQLFVKALRQADK